EPGRGRILMPELLLNDENLVQVDEEKKISRIRFNTPEGPKYLAYGEPGWQDYPDRKTQTPFWVSNDSGTLLPVDIQASTNKQFWITVKVPEEAKPGQYQGKINLISDGSTLKELNLILSVLPFKLSAPYYQTSVWVHEGANSIEKRYRNMVKNQIEHGITVLMSHLNLRDVDEFTLWEKTLKIRQEIRVPTEILLLAEHPLIYRELAGASHKGLTRIDITEEKKKRFIEGYQKYRELANSYGYKEIWFYMADERDGKELEAWLPVYELVRQIGAKSMTANHIGRTFEIAGGKHDVFVCENGVTKKEADRWHAAGEKIWATWTPSGGVEDFEVNRRNHGLLVWKAGYDGVTEYLYGKENGWVEAASTTTGAAGDGIYNMVYLTTDGIIDTIQWEGFREAVDDVRYITTLEKLVAQAKKSGKKQKEVTAAEKYLKSIDAKYGNLDEIRNNVIEHILKLR
ncbi:MAG: hypothetical protein N2115_02005, partial [bacterium]|nr:hypothetical protein [bacterium]